MNTKEAYKILNKPNKTEKDIFKALKVEAEIRQLQSAINELSISIAENEIDKVTWIINHPLLTYTDNHHIKQAPLIRLTNKWYINNNHRHLIRQLLTHKRKNQALLNIKHESPLIQLICAGILRK